MGASGEARLSTMDLGASLRLFHLGAWRVRGIVLFFRGFLDFIASCFCCTQISLSSFFFYYYSKKFHRKFAHCTQQSPPIHGPSQGQGRWAPFLRHRGHVLCKYCTV